MDVQILKGNYSPTYKTEGAAAADLIANIEQPLTLQPMERAIVPLGLFMALPKDLVALLFIRSGTAFKKGLQLVNGVGVIDCDYRGEVGAIIVNLSNEPQTIEPKERICQLLIAKAERVNFVPVDSLPTTVRGSGGFGSTGA